MNEIIANFLDIVKNKYAKLNEPAGRKELWYFCLVNAVIGFVLAIIAVVLLEYKYGLF